VVIGAIIFISCLKPQTANWAAACATSTANTRVISTTPTDFDDLVFGEGERGHGDDMALLFEAINDFYEAEKEIVRTVLAGMVLHHSACKLDAQRAPAKAQGSKR